MKNIQWSILGVLAAATLLAACDPYSSQSTAAPAVVMVTATSGSYGAYTAGTQSGSAWTVADVPSTCDATTGAVASDEPLLFATSNQLLDGASIQASTADCTPAGGWLTVTPAAPIAGDSWYSCFQPGSPSPDLGSAVIMFSAASGGAQGWYGASLLPADGDAVTTYQYTGSVRDWQGQAMAIDITTTVAPNPGAAGDPTYTNIAATSVTVSWTAAACESAGNTTYTVERAPDVAGAPGTWAVVMPAAASTYTFNDTGLTTGTTYWYRVTTETSTGYVGPTSGQTSVTTL